MKNIFGREDEIGVNMLLELLGIKHFFDLNRKDFSVADEFSLSQNLRTLSDIVWAFSKIPYENITKHDFTKKRFMTPFDLALGFKYYGTGGTCFPLVWSLKKVLDIFRFNSFISLADRTYAPRSHCLIFVRLGEKLFAVDIGFSVFQPVDVSVERNIVKLPQGWLEFRWEGNKILVDSVFPNGHRKFRYEVVPEPATKDEFLGAWEETFKFEMMNHVILAKLTGDELIYIKDIYVHFIKDGVSRNLKLEPERVVEISQKLGVRKDIFERALWRILKNREK